MADVNANIGVNIDTSEALAQLKALQRQISQFHSSIAKSSESAALAQRDLQKNFLNSVNSIGAFSAELRTIKTTAESFTDSLEKNKFSMREYFRYAGGATKTFGRLFRSEFDTINKVAEENVKRLQTQYIKMGRDASGAMRAIAIMPNELDMSNMSTQLQVASQRQAIFNQLIKQGSTNLLNFGKNTQWAGRQLMVGFTLPLATLGITASKTFMDMEQAALKFRKVYGDLFTPASETNAALASITELGQMFTRYGIAVSDTVALSAEAAAAGFQGLDLQRQTAQATRLSVLGQVESQKALETTISLQNAFKMSSEDLAGAIDFLNAVENQTVVSLDDITTAIPKVAPVIQQLGGDVKDLAFFMAAMKEGGVNASEGANALKSGLAALINPTEKASEFLANMGINIKEIIESNKGDLKATVIEFAQALDGLEPLARARAIEQLFGKFQFARLSTLFDNVTNQTGQAARVLDLAGTSIEDLAALSEKELGMTADSAMNRFRKSVEDLKFALIPVGETFLQAVTPILEFVGDLIEKFDNLPTGVKKAITVITIAIGAIGPVALMAFGLLANGLANIIKFVQILRNGYLRLTGQTQVLGEQTQFLTVEQQNALAVAHSLDQSHAKLVQTFNAETGAVMALKKAYEQALGAASRFASVNPGMMRKPRGFASGILSVPGPKGAGDIVPAMLSPGEAVIPADMAQKYGALLSGIIADNIPGFQGGRRSAYWTAGKRNALLDALGLTGDQRARIPLEATSAAYSVSGVMAPRSVNRQTGIGMTQEYLQSPLGRAATMANLEVGLEDLGLSAERMAEVLNDVSPQITKAIDTWDGSIEGWQKASRNAMDTIQQSTKITAAEKDVIRRRFAPINPDDYAVGSNLVTEVSRRRATTRNERVDAQRAYGSERQLQKLRARGFNVGPGFDFAHMPGYERISASSVRLGAPTVAGMALSSQQQAILQQEKIAFEKFRKEQDALAAKNAQSAVTATAKAAGTASPSRKTIPIGEDIARGLEVGMANRTDDVARSGQALSNAAVTGVRGGRRAARSAGGTVGSGGVIIPPGGTGGGGGGGPTFLGMPGMPERRQTVGQRFKNFGSKFGAGRFAGAGMAASMGVMAASMAPGPVGDLASKAMPAVFGLQALQMALKLPIPHIKAFAAVTLAGIGIIKAVNAARERERIAIEGLADAATMTEEKLKTLGDFFGVVPTDTPFQSALPQTLATPQERTQLQALKASEGFQNTFKKDIESLRKATSKEAELVFKSLAVDLKGRGFATTQVQTIIDALREEAGKTDVKIDVKSLNLETKEGRAQLKSTVDEILTGFGKAYDAGLKKEMTQVGKQAANGAYYIDWVEQLVPTKELKRNAKASAQEISNMISGISGQFASGAISGEEFNKSFDSLTTSLQALQTSNPSAALMVMENVMKTLPEDVYNVVKGVKSLDGNMMLLKMQSLGMTASLAGVAEALRLLENPLADVTDKVKAQLLVTATLNEIVKRTKEVEDYLKKALGTGGGAGDGEETIFEKAIKQLKELDKQLGFTDKAFTKLERAGLSAAEAFEIAKDPILSAAVATTKVGTKNWELLLKLIKETNKEAQALEMREFFKKRTEELSIQRNIALLIPQLKDLGLEVQDIEEIINNPDLAMRFFKDLKDGKLDSAALKRYIDEIPDFKKIKVAMEMKTDEEVWEELYDKAMEYFDKVEERIRRQYDAQVKAAEAAVEAAQDAVDAIQQEIDDLQSRIDDDRRTIELTLSRPIEDLQEEISDLQRQLEIQFDRPIEELNKQIAGIQREIETEFDRPIAALQEESSDLSNDLAIMDQAADAINKKYDLQAEALNKVSEINQDIINQQKSQIGLADALSRGDIAAAAQAAQDMRQQAAEAASRGAGATLEAARQAELSGLTSASGMTREQIEARQFQISQQIYRLEEQREIKQARITALQDQIYQIDLKRQPILEAIRKKEDDIYTLTELRENAERAIRDLEDEIYLKKIGNNSQDEIGLDYANKKLKAAQDEVKAIEEQIKKDIEKATADRAYWIEANNARQDAILDGQEYNNVLTITQSMASGILTTWQAIVQQMQIAAALSGSGSGSGSAQFKTFGGKIKRMASGGWVPGNGLKDSVPAMLTPGEFVVNKAAAKEFAPLLRSLNGAKYPSMIGSMSEPKYALASPVGINAPSSSSNSSYSDNSNTVYNYSVGITVGGSNASPENIAQTVMNEIKYIDSQRIKGGRIA